MRHLVLGPPGTGKTTRLLGVVSAALASGVPPDQIAYVSFTRAAVREARDRAAAQLRLDPAQQLPYFRTLHSLCFQQLGLRSSEVFTRRHYEAFGELVGETLTGALDLEAPASDSGDGLLHLDHYARVTQTALAEAWRDHGGDIDWWRLQRFNEAYRLFKQDSGLLDFTDMLARYVDHGESVPVQLAIIDEAQDLTPLQWQVVRRAFGDVPQLYAAGDDDQTIFRWSGADPSRLISWRGSVEVLPHSYRLPAAIWALAGDVSARMERRAPKAWRARQGDPGRVEWIRDVDEVDLSSGKWLLLARTRRQLTQLRDVARHQGVAYWSRGQSSIDPVILRTIQAYETLRAGRPVSGDDASNVLAAFGVGTTLPGELDFTSTDLEAYGGTFTEIWHDALRGIALDDREYYLACLRRGEKLTETPRVRIETIHGSKGLEADHVLLQTTTTGRIQRGFELDPDSEHRVFYVGVTRARQSLWVQQPTGPHGYQL
jgi:superfamily I DNA/RNA helicase